MRTRAIVWLMAFLALASAGCVKVIERQSSSGGIGGDSTTEVAAPSASAASGPAALTGKPAPPLQVANWLNSSPLKLEDLQGKVVVLDFWAHW